jgi:hypothetical protein
MYSVATKSDEARTHSVIPSLAVAQDGLLQRVTIPEAADVQFTSLTS